MANSIYTVDLKTGLVSPFPDNAPVQTDSFSSSGAYIPKCAMQDIVNAMPTEFGYMSYFGDDLGLGSLGDRYIQDVIVLRTFKGTTLLLGLTPDALYVCCPGSRAVSALVTQPLPDPAVKHLTAVKTINLIDMGFDWLPVTPVGNPCPDPWARWTWAVVSNRIYFHQAGQGSILEITDGIAEQVKFNYYNPEFIVGIVKLYTWTINLAIASTDTVSEQTLTFNPEIGTFVQHFVNKLHVRAALTELWQQKIAMYVGSKVTVG